MTATTFAVEFVFAQDRDSDTDLLIIAGANSDGSDVTIEITPSEDEGPYEEAARRAGFVLNGETAVRAASAQ